MSPHFSRTVVYLLLWVVGVVFMMFARLRQWFLNLNFPGRLVLFASLALSACTGVSANRKVWSTPEIIDNEHSDGSPNAWQLLFDTQGNGIVVTDDINRVWANRYTADSGWGTPELIDDMAIPAEDASYGDAKDKLRLFFDTSGNALVVWQQYHSFDTPHKTWTNRYTVGAGWGKAAMFDNTPGDDLSPEIVSDARGNAFAVWTQNNDECDSYQLWASIYIPEAGWGKAMVIAQSAGDAKMIMVKVDVLGNAYAVWLQGKDKREIKLARSFDVWISRYTAGTGWGKAQLIMRDTEAAYPLEITLDGRGNALVAWEQKVGDQSGIWVNRYLADKGWDQPVRIDPEIKYGDAREPVIAFDAQGNAIVMWWQAGSNGNVFASRYTPGTGWGTATTVSSQTQSAQRPRLVYDKDGNALAVWTQLDHRSDDSVMASRYTVAVGWSTPVLLSKESKEGKSDPRIAIDEEGNAIAVWWQRGGMGASIWLNHYDAAKGWGAPKLLQTDSTFTATEPDITFDAKGIAHVSWTRSPSENQSYRVWTSRFLPTQLLSQQTVRNHPRTMRSRDADSHVRNSIGYTSLHDAAFNGKPDKAAQLITEGLDINVKDYDESTPLHVAANQGHRNVVELLIAQGANVNARTRNGKTPLHEAASWGTREVAEILIAKGANLHAKDGDHHTPLHLAATRGKTDTAELLIAKGADVNALTPSGSTPLTWAVAEERKDIVALLLANGAATNPKGGNDTSPLHWAAREGNREIVELLLAHGAVVNIKDSVEHTPLYVAMFGKNLAIVELLLAKGAEVNVKTKDGDTPLHMAREKEAAALLIAKGANANAKGNFGYTPLHKAAREGRQDIAELLIDKGADINARNNEGETPLDAALEKYHQDLAAMLMAHGAKKGVD